MLILRQFQRLKATSVCNLITSPSSWEVSRSILKFSRAIFLISRLLFEKMNFCINRMQQLAKWLQKCKIFLRKVSPQNVKIRFSQNHLRCSPMVWNGFGDTPRVSKNVFHHFRAFAAASENFQKKAKSTMRSCFSNISLLSA